MRHGVSKVAGAGRGSVDEGGVRQTCSCVCNLRIPPPSQSFLNPFSGFPPRTITSVKFISNVARGVDKSTKCAFKKLLWVRLTKRIILKSGLINYQSSLYADAACDTLN